MNLGAVINTPVGDGGPSLSRDGRQLFFWSARPGGQGAADLWVSHRSDPHDDFDWESPVNLGPDVNTAANEFDPDYLPRSSDGPGGLFFHRVVAGLRDIYYAPVNRNGETRGPAVLVTELSDPTADDAEPGVRRDGKEILFRSTRAGGHGGFDIWVSTRSKLHAPWSQPENLGAPINTAFNEARPGLSRDGRTLVFDSDGPGGVGGQDIWMSTRTLLGDLHDDDDDDHDIDGDDDDDRDDG